MIDFFTIFYDNLICYVPVTKAISNKDGSIMANAKKTEVDSVFSLY